MSTRPSRPGQDFGTGVQALARKGSRLHEAASRLRACTACASDFAPLGHCPRPVARLSSRARIAVCSQAPGTRVHENGLPFDDRSGVRLREWMGLDRAAFYDLRHIAIVPMGFCFPGQNRSGGDLLPPARCAELWREELFSLMPRLELLLLVGLCAQRYHLGARSGSLQSNVERWREFLEDRLLPLPHPSWRNNRWLADHPWFAREVLPELRRRIASVVQ